MTDMFTEFVVDDREEIEHKGKPAIKPSDNLAADMDSIVADFLPQQNAEDGMAA